MAKRKGRPFEGKPFRQKKDGVEYGSYNVYDPIAKKRLSLETDDLNAALAKVQSLFGDLIGKSVPKATTSVSAPFVGAAEPLAEPAISNDEPDPRTVIDDWAKLGASGQQALPLGLEDAPMQTPPVQREATVTPITSARKPKNSSGLSDSDIKTLTTGMHKIVASANVALLDFTVRQLGRVPIMPSEDEMEMLATGWELQLKEIFKDIEMKPYMLIVAANALIGMAMYSRGEPIPKKKIQAPSVESK